MCKYLYIVEFLLFSAIIDISFQINQDSISQETGEIYERNKVVDSASKEVFDKSKRDENNSKYRFGNDLSSELTNSSTEAKVNTSSQSTTPCGQDAADSSEENTCRSTLVNYPFSVSIQKKGAHYTSGALIDKQFVITVADEFFNVRETIKLFRVRLGSVDCKKGGVFLPIKEVEIHPLFVKGFPSFDVALLKLSQPVEVTEYIKPIGLSRVQQGVISAKFLTTYWPRLIVKGEIVPLTAKERLKHHSMRVSTQKLIPWRVCSSQMSAWDTVLNDTSLCLKPIATHHSLCSPDVGAPVVADDGLWGITSGWTSDACSDHPSPTIFTRTNKKLIRSWIQGIIGSTDI